MKSSFFFLAMVISTQAMAAEVVLGENGKYSCMENGRSVAAGEDGLYVTNSPLKAGNRCGALKKQEKPAGQTTVRASEYVVFSPSQSPRGVRFGFRLLF